MSCQMRQEHEKLRVPHESFEVVQVQVAKYTTLFDGFLFSYRFTNRHSALWGDFTTRKGRIRHQPS